CVLAGLDPQAEQWGPVAPEVAKALVKEGPLHVERWMNAMRPVRGRLLEPLTAILRSEHSSEVERSLAITVLADFAADRPDVLVDLIQFADSAAFDTILARLESHHEQAVSLLTRALAERADPPWPDPIGQPAWERPSQELVRAIERAQGLVS